MPEARKLQKLPICIVCPSLAPCQICLARTMRNGSAGARASVEMLSHGFSGRSRRWIVGGTVLGHVVVCWFLMLLFLLLVFGQTLRPRGAEPPAALRDCAGAPFNCGGDHWAKDCPEAATRRKGTLLSAESRLHPTLAAQVTNQRLPPRPPNVPLLRALWSLFDGIWGILKGSWGVLACRLFLLMMYFVSGIILYCPTRYYI